MAMVLGRLLRERGGETTRNRSDVRPAPGGIPEEQPGAADGGECGTEAAAGLCLAARQQVI
ncbi:hypothetical protein ACOBR2_17080 [Telmatobacter bradus]|uniref:hypothetical protein n=1 Tax=Telmatobacter bradus TaxID=474953 RepID=UPI003B42FEFB